MTYSWKKRGLNPEAFDVGDDHWQPRLFGNKGHVFLKYETEYDDMIAAAVATNLYIPYPHRICSIEAKHTDGTGANSTIALTAASFQIHKWPTASGDSQWFVIWDFSGVAGDADYLLICGDGYEVPQNASYRFVTNTTNGHRMYYELVIQLLDKRGRELPGEG